MSSISQASAAAKKTIAHDYSKRAMVFGGRCSQDLAAKIAGKLDLSLGEVTLKTFSDGEIYGRYEDSIRGADVFLVQSTCQNKETGMTPNDALMELMIMADAAQGASAHRIIAVMPWFGYARQDKKHRGREPISARLIADLFATAGADRLMSVDLHTAQIQGFFDGPLDHLWALPLLSDYVRTRVDRTRLHLRPQRALQQVRAYAARVPEVEEVRQRSSHAGPFVPIVRKRAVDDSDIFPSHTVEFEQQLEAVLLSDTAVVHLGGVQALRETDPFAR